MEYVPINSTLWSGGRIRNGKMEVFERWDMRELGDHCIYFYDEVYDVDKLISDDLALLILTPIYCPN